MKNTFIEDERAREMTMKYEPHIYCLYVNKLVKFLVHAQVLWHEERMRLLTLLLSLIS